MKHLDALFMGLVIVATLSTFAYIAKNVPTTGQIYKTIK